jgi:mannose-1-phosphate guanylyltransferase
MSNPNAREVFAVIMAGGSGTRFWPLSRGLRPKQFLPLATKRSLIEETMERLKGVAAPRQTFVVCGSRHAALARGALKRLPAANVLVEPEARNTAPAIALATAHVASKNPRGVLVVLPSDQHVADAPAFRAAIAEAVRMADEGLIVTLGITPTRPETGYGYVKLGGKLSGTARKVAAFVEKPDVATAKKYLRSGQYLWNAGIFVFRADTMLDAFAQLMPECTAPLTLIQKSIGTSRERAVLTREFKRLPATSIDYGIAEKASNIAVVPASCGWSDVGSFNALADVRPKDENGNVVQGEHAILIDSSGSVVWGGKRPIAVVGMKDIVVVDAGDSLLVVPKDKCQDVRKVIEALKAQGLTEFL